MPGVTVLPVMSATTPTAAYNPNRETLILDSMPSPAEGSVGVDSVPSPHHTKEIEDTTTDGAGGGGGGNAGQGETPERPSKGGGPGIDKSGSGDSIHKDEGSSVGVRNVSPSQSINSYPHALPAHLTQQQPGYYVYNNSQVTPEPSSPAGPGSTSGTGYDVGAFFQQPGGGTTFQNSAFTTAAGAAQQYPYATQQQQHQQPPQSPSQNNSVAGSVPPASPLFPRATGGQTGAATLLDHVTLQQRGVQLSPGPAYLASPQIASQMYAAMGAYGNAGHTGTSNDSTSSPAEFGGWGDNRSTSVGQTSPQISAQGIPIPYVPGMPPPRTNRSYSFDSESMLPPSAESQQPQDQNQTYSAYVAGQTNSAAAAAAGTSPATLFAHQAWGYPGGPQPEMYPGGGSPLQPRATMSYPGLPGGPPRHGGAPHPHMAPYGGQFYPATSPGPPIQTTTSNKGPDGANLFIFHIPNHFTNLDMYQLFCPYGNLLSVRIMVEKDTGRSRGFGFVSYDSPDAAALAIKELNGFPIGNKRLKVQHKQIRPSDQHDRGGHGNNTGYDNMGGHHGNSGSGGYQRNHMSLPPSGPMAMSNNSWYYNTGAGGGGGVPQGSTGVDGTNPVQQQLQPQDSQHHHQQQPDPNSNPSSPPREEADAGEALSNLDPLRQNLPEVGSGGGGEGL